MILLVTNADNAPDPTCDLISHHAACSNKHSRQCNYTIEHMHSYRWRLNDDAAAQNTLVSCNGAPSFLMPWTYSSPSAFYLWEGFHTLMARACTQQPAGNTNTAELLGIAVLKISKRVNTGRMRQEVLISKISWHYKYRKPWDQYHSLCHQIYCLMVS